MGEVSATTEPLTLATLDGVESSWGFPDRLQLTYCVDTASFGGNAATFLAAMDSAANSWADRASVRFERVTVGSCNNSDTSVVFNVRQTNLGGALASAFFPYNGRSSRELLVDPAAFTATTGGVDLDGILRHELGHVLGFRHEHIWLAVACTTEEVDDTVPEGALGATALTPYDVDSVMHYPQCRPSNGGGLRQSPEDYRGAIALYGLAPALVEAAVL
ncbi:MAG: hypothetical protein SangKO_003780 [Sandaracinaceae bacterium]